jgi:hypothetical protein
VHAAAVLPAAAAAAAASSAAPNPFVTDSTLMIHQGVISVITAATRQQTQPADNFVNCSEGPST